MCACLKFCTWHKFEISFSFINTERSALHARVCVLSVSGRVRCEITFVDRSRFWRTRSMIVGYIITTRDYYLCTLSDLLMRGA